jgi:hypothetical protein
MKTRQFVVSGALLFAAVVMSHGAFAQGGDKSSGGSASGQTTGMDSKTAPDQPTGAASSHPSSGTLMQKRERGMSADHPASSPQSTGKMPQ